MLVAAGGALGATVVAIALDGGFRSSAFLIWVALGAASLLDFLLSWRRAGNVEISHPEEIFVGEDFNVALTFSKGLPPTAATMKLAKGLRGPEEFVLTTKDRQAQARVPIRAVRRGTWELETLWLRWTSRLGLFEFVPRIALGRSVNVVPNIRLVQSGQITTTVNSMLFGSKENRAIGEGSEFHQLRDFVTGMDVKSIDWKRSAHRGALVAKELRAERNHHVIVALDNGYLMGEEIAGLPKIDHAITAALATAWAAVLGGDLVGLYSYDIRPRVFSPPEAGTAAFARLRSRTADLDYVERDTNHTLAMASLGARTPKRSLIIVFTDFIDAASADLMLENLQNLSKRHLVIFVTIRDPEVEDMVQTAPHSLGGVANVVSARLTLTQRKIVLEKLSRMGVTVVDAAPGQVSAQLISKYLEIKAAELI